jgi:hypothetical protein
MKKMIVKMMKFEGHRKSIEFYSRVIAISYMTDYSTRLRFVRKRHARG